MHFILYQQIFFNFYSKKDTFYKIINKIAALNSQSQLTFYNANIKNLICFYSNLFSPRCYAGLPLLNPFRVRNRQPQRG